MTTTSLQPYRLVGNGRDLLDAATYSDHPLPRDPAADPALTAVVGSVVPEVTEALAAHGSQVDAVDAAVDEALDALDAHEDARRLYLGAITTGAVKVPTAPDDEVACVRLRPLWEAIGVAVTRTRWTAEAVDTALASALVEHRSAIRERLHADAVDLHDRARLALAEAEALTLAASQAWRLLVASSSSADEVVVDQMRKAVAEAGPTLARMADAAGLPGRPIADRLASPGMLAFLAPEVTA